MSLDVATKPLIKCDELVSDGLRARCLVLATLLDQRLIALGLFPATVKILFYLLAVDGKKIREELLGLHNILDRYSRYLRTSTYVQK